MQSHHRVLPDAIVATLAAHLEQGGGRGLEVARGMPPDQVIDVVTDAGLRGRGGAGFPTGKKWRSVRDAAEASRSTPAVVCNAAEGEPGTFKDRPLIARNPYAVLEGLLVAMHAVGAPRGFVGIKERFAVHVERLIAARDEMIAAGWIGDEELVVVPGPDEYLLGEEKALLEVIEGKPALPRILPPYETGLFATVTQPHPTVVNNVETLVHASQVFGRGAEWFRELGTHSSPGTMVFTAVGDVRTAGYWELPLGMPLRALLEDLADADDIKVVYSGTSNTAIPSRLLDTPMDFDAMEAAGTGLGSGGFIAYDANRCIVRVLAALTRFLAVESCGQCLACKLGTTQLHELLERIEEGLGDRNDLETIRSRVPTVTDQARCYLPTGAQLMVGSTLELFEDEFVSHLGSTCADSRPVPVPLVEDIDDRTGTVTLHRSWPAIA